ncbi:MAG: tetratricopeptide repeat protein, partial [Planctomycetota bacterium]
MSDTDTNPGDALRSTATDHYNAARLDDALATWEQALELDAADHRAWAGKGLTLGAMGEYEAAIAAYTRAVSLKKDFAIAWFQRAEAHRALFQLEQAIEDYNESIRIGPTDQAWFGRALAHTALSDFEAALGALTSCIDINPDHAEAYLNRAYLLGYQGKLSAALADFDIAIDELQLLDAIAIGSRAMTRLARGVFAGAIADFETASTVAPDSWRPLAGLAAAHAEAGNMEKARKA